MCQSSEWREDTDGDIEAGRTAHMYTHTHTHSVSPLRSLSVCSGVFTATLNALVCSGPSRCQLLAFQCNPDGSFLPLQCDLTSCWCVSEDGQEVSGTRTLGQTGQMPSCDRECVSGTVVCQNSHTPNPNSCSSLPQLPCAPPPPFPMVHWCASQRPVLFKVVT